MADIILDCQRDYPVDVSRYTLPRGIHLLQVIAKEQIIFSHVRCLFCLIFSPQKQLSVLNIVPPP